MWSTPFWTRRNTRVQQEKLTLSSHPTKTPARSSRGISGRCRNYQPVPSFCQGGEREKERSESPSRYMLALPMTLCLTCNQNNSNPVTVCLSAKFLNFSRRQQALGVTGCLSDSSRICQSPSSEATGKLNASEQGHSHTFPLHTPSGFGARILAEGARTWGA